MVSSIVLLYNVCLATPCRTTDSLLLEPTVFKPISQNMTTYLSQLDTKYKLKI